MDEPLFGLGVQVEVFKDELCEINSESEDMPKCILTENVGSFSDDEFIITSTGRQGNTFLSATRPRCRFSKP